jgi:A/G-specific adenine glycosylase
MGRFPTPAALAGAPSADVIRAWRGLGYNRRALNLQRAMQTVETEFAGRFPEVVDDLERLPGIGPYTARAVAAIALGRPVGAVDTNVRRVLGRALAGSEAGTVPPVAMQAMADASVDPDRPGDWTHAVMDIGATVCAPRAPLCGDCPLRFWCRFAATSPSDASPREAPPRNASASRPRATSFTATTRWLRGRIVDRLRDGQGDTWSTVEAPIGDHDAAAVRSALAALARDGIVELDPADPHRARLALD